MTLQAVTPEELDEWLQTTEVADEDEAVPDIEPLPVDLPMKEARPPKKKKASWRRRSSLDEDNISSRPCFGIDAKALLASESQEDVGDAETTLISSGPRMVALLSLQVIIIPKHLRIEVKTF